MDHSDSPHQDSGQSFAAPTGLVAIGTRILISALENAGYMQSADLVKRWPELIGAEIGKPLRRISQKQLSGEPITPEDKHELNTAIEQNPKEAELLVGPMLAQSMGATMDADTSRKKVLTTYANILDIVCEYMRVARTSVLLRGFIHDCDCLSYWKYISSGPKFTQEFDSLRPSKAFDVT